MTANRASHITHPSGLTLPRSVVNHGRTEAAQKISWDDARRIRTLYAAGQSYADIAARYKVHRNTVSDIVNHRGKWK